MAKKTIEKILTEAGIHINGPRPWDPQVHHPKFFDRILSQGSLGVGESYMEGWWDCDQLDELANQVFQARVEAGLDTWKIAWDIFKVKVFNLQNKSRAFHNASHHYNIGNDLYERMLGKRMMYSCAYWLDADNLNQAQENKLALTCKKLDLKPGMKVLDIGCGWGGLAEYMAQHYDVRTTGITVSQNQFDAAKQRCQNLPVEILLQDYRDLNETYDRIVSIGMFEHVGPKNYRTFFNTAARCLKDHGIFLLHTIGVNQTQTCNDPWIQKYIFPGAYLPSIRQIAEASERRLVMEDWHNIGPHYDPTLMAWYQNFEKHWPELKKDYDERFYRMWRFYLLTCAGTFRARKNQVWQVLFSKRGLSPALPRVR